jgi:hypothetical protein
MPVAKDDFAVATVDGLIYTFGGMTGSRGTVLDDAAVYDPGADAWRSLPPLPTPRRSVRAAAIGPIIYVVGGVTANGATAIVETFDTRSGTWAPSVAMPTPRYGVGLAAAEGVLVAIGGFRDGEALSTVERYDPEEGRWFAAAPMPTARTHPAVAVVEGRIYVLGGETGGASLTTVEIYDPILDRWTTGPPLPVAMSNFAAGTVDGSIHVMRHHDHLIRGAGSSTWEPAEAMPTPRHGQGVAVVAGILYAIGGCHEQLFDLDVVEAYGTTGPPDEAPSGTGVHPRHPE